MKNLFVATLLLISLQAESNSSNESNVTKNITIETNSTVKDINKSSETKPTKVDTADKQLQKHMEREKKFAKEQIFYQGKTMI